MVSFVKPHLNQFSVLCKFLVCTNQQQTYKLPIVSHHLKNIKQLITRLQLHAVH